MKIRTDFVSNSSSSSFVIWGMNIPVDKLINAAKTDITKPVYDEIKTKYGPDYSELIAALDEGDSIYELSEIIEKLCKIEVVYDYNNSEVYIGLEPSKMKDNETLSEFKDRVIASVSNGLPSLKPKNVEFYKGVDCDGEISVD